MTRSRQPITVPAELKIQAGLFELEGRLGELPADVWGPERAAAQDLLDAFQRIEAGDRLTGEGLERLRWKARILAQSSRHDPLAGLPHAKARETGPKALNYLLNMEV